MYVSSRKLPEFSFVGGKFVQSITEFAAASFFFFFQMPPLPPASYVCTTLVPCLAVRVCVAASLQSSSVRGESLLKCRVVETRELSDARSGSGSRSEEEAAHSCLQICNNNQRENENSPIRRKSSLSPSVVSLSITLLSLSLLRLASLECGNPDDKSFVAEPSVYSANPPDKAGESHLRQQ